jgi:hypothetical protein
VKAFLTEGYVMGSPADVFLSVYLSERPEAQGLRVPGGVKRFKEAIARVERRRSDARAGGVPPEERL